MNLNLEQKVIIVTGGASGIGRGIVEHLAEEGVIVCVIDRDAEQLRLLSEALVQAGRTVLGFAVDLNDQTACRETIQRIWLAYGRIDGLVNNAGINDGVGLADGDYARFVQSLRDNACHYYTMAQLVLPALRESRGAIVNICSKVAVTGQGGTSGYAAANGLRMEMVGAWAAELAETGVRVNGVVVAECLTPQYQWWIGKQPDPAAALNEIKARIPLGRRMTTTDEIADTVLFLLSACTSVSGELVHVDGGYVHLDRSV